MQFCIVLLKYVRPLLRRHHLDGICCSKTDDDHFASVILKELWPREDDSISGSYSLIFLLSMIEVWPAFVDGALNCAHRQWECSWAHTVISVTELCLFLMQWRSQACMPDFWLPPLHTEISTDSCNLLMTLCVADYMIFKVLIIHLLQIFVGVFYGKINSTSLRCFF